MRSSVLIMVSFLSILIPEFSGGQSFYTKQFTIEKGLPSNTVRAIFKDSRQLMWVGTASGLCRFNGREFTVYNSSDGLAAENIFDITEDDSGNLWIGSMGGGISMFDGEKFTNYTTADGLLSNEVRRVWWSKKFHLLMIGTNMGCCIFDGQKFYSLDAKAVKNLTGTYFVLGFVEEESYIKILAYGFTRVFSYYPSSHSFVEEAPGTNNFSGPSCSPIIMNNGDTVSGRGREGISVWNDGLKRKFDSLGQVFNMALDTEGNIWIAAWAEAPSGPAMPGGLYRYDGERVERLSEKAGISDPSVWTVYFDTVFHVVWIGTLHQGLFRMPYPCFTWFTPDFFGLKSMKINDVHADRENNIWIATSREVIRMDQRKGYYLYPQDQIKSAQRRSMEMNYPLFSAALRDPDGSYEKYERLKKEGKFPFPNPYLLIMSDLGYVNKVSPGTLYDPRSYRKGLDDLKGHMTDTNAICYYSIGEDSRNNIYISGGFGISRFPPGKIQVSPEVIPVTGNSWVFAFDEADTLFASSYWDLGMWHCAMYPGMEYPERYYYTAERDSAPANPIRMISRGREIWSASRQGGLYLTRDGKTWAFSLEDNTLPFSVNDICFDGDKNVIVGANNGEVLVGKVRQEKFQVLFRLNQQSGINGKSIRWVQTDRNRTLYIGTNDGLNVVSLDSLFITGRPDIRFFSPETGFYNRSGTRAIADTSGNIWIASETSLCQVSHLMIKNYPLQRTRLILNGLEINNIPIDRDHEMNLKPWFNFPREEIVLDHDQNNLIFHFDALNYLNPESQRFRYRLMPVIKNWIELTTDRKAAFNTLSPGSYQLEIEGLNLLDKNQVSRLSYRFSIRYPFYLKWWFILLAMLFLGGTTVLVWMLRVRQIRNEEKRKADIRLELNKIEMKALKAQMNPHFIFNAINSIQSYILSNNVDKALYYLSMFAKLVRMTLEISSKEEIPLFEEMNYLNFYIELEKMRYEGEFTTETYLDPKLPLETTMVPPMIVQPFVENAIKHGLLNLERVGHLKIMAKKLNDLQFQFVVEDDGVGRKHAEKRNSHPGNKHHSRALSITSTRIELLNQTSLSGKYLINIIDLVDEEGKPAGTRVEVTFPLN